MTRELEIKLLNCKSLSEFVAMFMGLSMSDKLSVFTEDVPVAKGANFYRIRRVDAIKDPNDPKEWAPVPV